MKTSYVPLSPSIVVKKINSFKSLPEGWNFGEGKPAKSNCIDSALRILNEAVDSGYIEMDVFPGMAGEVCITIYDGDYDLEFIAEINDTITISKICGREELDYQESLNIDYALLYIRNYKKEVSSQWNYLGSSTSKTTMIEREEGLIVSPLKTWTVESQSLRKTVSKKKSANILGGITATSQAPHQFIGNSTSKFCPQVSV